jgi:hypothetical protein
MVERLIYIWFWSTAYIGPTHSIVDVINVFMRETDFAAPAPIVSADMTVGRGFCKKKKSKKKKKNQRSWYT